MNNSNLHNAVAELEQNDEQLNRPLVLVGLGPHAKRIYMHYFIKHQFMPKLIIELESKRREVMDYLTTNKMSSITFFISDEYRDDEDLPEFYQKKLLKRMKELGITHAIISTEPKSHFAYLKFFMSNRIHTLTDKPITSPIHVSTQNKMAKKIVEDFEVLADLYKKARFDGLYCEVQCQRRWHQGYRYIRSLLKQCIDQFGIPITQLDIYHCDGMWNMPEEFLTRENHPYKYGYGKLFHSGYHFIDLMCWLVKLNDRLDAKKTDKVEMYTMVVRPDDFMEVCNQDDYHRLFSTNKFDSIFANKNEYSFNQYGEIDFYSLVQFNRAGKAITTCSLTLLQNGFSRRSWTELPKDTYKSNGRVRHERVNIQVGPLMNIQVHSYQSNEIKERKEDIDNETGSIEHFEIFIFRNTDLIGGKPFEKITIGDLSDSHKGKSFIGFNEQARELCMVDFLSGQPDTSDLLDHDLSIKILSNAYLSMCNRTNGQSPIVTFDLE